MYICAVNRARSENITTTNDEMDKSVRILNSPRPTHAKRPPQLFDDDMERSIHVSRVENRDNNVCY